ncbi:restriction endonuclease subunit S [Methylomonas sp. CM2]|uniref:restriction endonuclease subunit S n=1 Tax=Methylomonas sp. CM2 TaxID=3417647 RepID=UPI003CF03493
MSELPAGWTTCPIKEIATIQSGIGFPEKYQGINDEKYPVYKVGDISRAYLNANGLLALAANYVSDEIATELKGRTFPIGSTVFAKIGEALKLNRRAYVIKEGLADNNVMGVIPDLSESNKYIYRFLQNFNIAALSRSTTVPSIRKSDLEEIEVWLPPKRTNPHRRQTRQRARQSRCGPGAAGKNSHPAQTLPPIRPRRRYLGGVDEGGRRHLPRKRCYSKI